MKMVFINQDLLNYLIIMFNIKLPSRPNGKADKSASYADDPSLTGCHNLNFSLASEFGMHLAQLLVYSGAMYFVVKNY